VDAGRERLILLVDDEPDLLTTCERLLRRGGYDVVSVGSVYAAVATLQVRPPRLVVSDVRLPDGTGLDVVRAARALATPAAAIVMTGQPSTPGRQAALAAGAAAYLPKPFSAGGFTDLVEKVLRP
jgi:DNA-binding NtrC family response regulator